LAAHVLIRPISDEEGMGLPQIVRRGELLAFLRYVHTLYRATTGIAIVLDNALAHLSHPQGREACTFRSVVSVLVRFV
jgi:hypothetical protein